MQPHEHLAGARRRQLDLLDGERAADGLQDRRPDLQRSPPGGRAPGVPSTSGGRSLTGGVVGSGASAVDAAARPPASLSEASGRVPAACARLRAAGSAAGPRLRRAPLQLAQLLDGVVAAPEVPGLDLLELRLLLVADVADVARAAGVEDAARRRVGVAGDLPLEPDPLALLAVHLRDGGQQRLRVRVVRRR